jgi:hypothetical protein
MSFYTDPSVIKFKPQTQFTDHQLQEKLIAQRLGSVLGYDVKLIADKMSALLLKSLKIDDHLCVPVRHGLNALGQVVRIEVNAKEEFILKAHLFFQQSMKENFENTDQCLLAKGDRISYSCNEIFQYALNTGSLFLQPYINSQLQKNYQMDLKLDLEKTTEAHDLVFVVTEIDNGKRMSTTFTIQELKDDTKYKPNNF